MGFKLVDDGTLDTVLKCEECGEEVRYGLESLFDMSDMDSDLTEDEIEANRVPKAMELAASDHECESDIDEAEEALDDDQDIEEPLQPIPSAAGKYLLINPDGVPIINPLIVGLSPLFDDLDEARNTAAPYHARVYALLEV